MTGPLVPWPNISITLVDDEVVEHDESFSITITSSRDDIMVSDSTVTVNIMDDGGLG